MRLAGQVTLVFWLAIAGILGRSQEKSIPFDKLQGASQEQSMQTEDSPNRVISTAPLPRENSAAERDETRPSQALRSRLFDSRYLLLNSIHLGIALLDVELTQNCIEEHKCREGNPIMPSSRAGQIGFDLGSVALTAAGSYWARKHNEKIWWIAPAAGIAAHTAGAATGFAHR
jgi:hypothetical protein